MDTPKLRFKKFSGEWQAKPLSSCLTISNLRNQDQSFDRDDVLSVSDEYGVVNQISLLGRSYAGEDISNYKVTLPGQLIYTKSPLKAKPYGIIKANHNRGIVSVLYAVYDVAELHSPSFLDYYFAPGYRTNKYLLPLVRKGAKNTLNISDPEFLLGKVAFPDDSKEQLAITDYFDMISDIIRCIEKEIESLRQVKTAAMVSMFPQKGENAPKVRFKGFDEPWTVDSIGNLFDERTERSSNGEMLSVTMRNGVIKASENGKVDNSSEDKSHYKVVKVNDIPYNTMRMWQGACGCSDYDGIVSPAYTVLIPKDGVNASFFTVIFKTQNMLNAFKAHSQGLTSDNWNLKYAVISTIPIKHPSSLTEQQKIAEFFQNLDRQIECQTQILERLKRVKAACLDQMFV